MAMGGLVSSLGEMICGNLRICVHMVEQLKAQFEEALQKYKEIENDREKYMNSRQQLESQLTENTLVKSEFEYLDEDAKVYKLIGACLVRQDIPEARANVDKRLEYINAEIKRVDESLSDFKEKADEQKAKLLELQQKLAAAK
ncbi:prefoldin subunit [Ancylostoma ceylanicum]|uniref:Probable prefoldin subunit 6 n=1 Tax=Ancylostoma ceylanicum TaxID=53326 RepID=A0A0D6M509_9BILA|nr:prefoldin subunit [Ancylostoma ceylanicum]